MKTLGHASLCMLSFCIFIQAHTASAFAIKSISPNGEAKQVRQIRIQFDQPMMSFGDLKKESAADVKCNGIPKEISASGRWIEPTEWVYEFSEQLPAGVICDVNVRTTLRDLKITSIQGAGHSRFSTGGPAIMDITPSTYDEIESQSAFLITIDSPVDLSSVVKHAYFVVDGIAEKIAIKIESDALKKEAMKHAYHSERWKNFLLISATRSFPAGGRVKFVWDKGVLSLSGVANTTAQTREYKVKQPLRATFSCYRENKDAQCSPLMDFAVDFSSPVLWRYAEKIEVHGADGKVYHPKVSGNDENIYSVHFQGPFPAESDFTVTMPAEFKDQLERPLANSASFPVKTRTAGYPPLAKFAARFGLIEASEQAALPITVRRLEPSVMTRMGEVAKANGAPGFKFLGFEWTNGKTAKIERPRDVIYWLNRVNEIDREFSLFDPERRLKIDANKSRNKPDKDDKPIVEYVPTHVPAPTSFQLPLPQKIDDTNVIGIPLKSKGFHVVEVESVALGEALLGKKASFYAPAAALVTNLAVHFKWGGENSLAWVTTLDKAAPVSGALVEVYDCDGNRLASGLTEADGGLSLVGLPGEPYSNSCRANLGYEYSRGLFVFATKGDDFSFTHTGWQKGIEAWRFNVDRSWSRSPRYVAHTVLDRSLFRAGETVHMKHVFRRAAGRGFELADQEHLPQQVEIAFYAGNSWKMPIKWRNDGSAETIWKIPVEAKLGTYAIILNNPNSRSSEYSEDSYFCTSFQVQEFRVALMKATLKAPASNLIMPDKIDVPFQLQYFAGGPASNMPVKFRGTSTVKKSFQFESMRDYSFESRQVVIGTRRHASYEDLENEGSSGNQDQDSDNQSPQRAINSKLKQTAIDIILDGNGGGSASFKDLPKKSGYDFAVEAEYRDPNGETQTARQSVSVFPAERLVGFDRTRWLNRKDDLQIRMAVVDATGKPLVGVPVDVALFSSKSMSHRKRIVGGFYSYENYDEIAPLAPKFCHTVSNESGLAECAGKIDKSGEVIAQAIVKDSKGRVFYGYDSMSVRGDDDTWYPQTADDRIDLIPEKKEYQPGDIAVFQVRSPFRDATALVTVEREGVLDRFVTAISGKDPTVAVPIKGIYGPNVFVSALLVRGRVGDIQPTALVDLGKPAYKMGLVGINVGWQAHRLNVSVAADRALYKPREKVKVQIKVRPEGDGEGIEHGTVLIAAVDEGLLQLAPNTTWDLLTPMMKSRSLAVDTSTSQMQVVGKRHFGLKSIAAGGGGGNGSPRKLFDTLLLWKDEVPLDSHGDAAVEIPLNDSLTSFRIVAIATSGTGRFGTGETTIKSSQDVLIFSGFPPVVREGDRFNGAVTVRNTGGAKVSLDITAEVKAVSNNGANLLPGMPTKRQLDLDAGASEVVKFDITVPKDISGLKWLVDTKSRAGISLDRMEASQEVKPVVPVRSWQSVLRRVEPIVTLDIERPQGAIAGRGGIRAELTASLSTQLGGAETYMQEYPYSCLEQRVSKAVTFNDASRWNTIVEGIGSYLDMDGLAKYFPSQSWGDEVLTSYILTIAAANNFEMPKDAKEKMVGGLNSWLSGRIHHVGSIADTLADRPMRRMLALLALSWAGDKQFVTKYVNHLEAQPQIWPTTTLVSWYELLLRETSISNRATLLKEAESNLQTRLHSEGNMMKFANGDGDEFSWLLISSDETLARLIAIGSEKSYQSLSSSFKGDLPRMIQGLFSQQVQGHWTLTTGNAWSSLALRKFGAVFEAEALTGKTDIQMAKENASWNWPSKKEHNEGDDYAKPSFTVDLKMEDAKAPMILNHVGTGAPWVTVSSRFAIPVTAPIKSGMSLDRKIIPVEQKVKGKWSRGDLVRVELTMSSSAAQSWVVLNDAIPAGSSILGAVGNESSILTANEKQTGHASIAFQERSFAGIRVYYDRVDDRPWHYSYTFRLNQDGIFELPASRVEAMYAPGMFAEVPTEKWVIE